MSKIGWGEKEECVAKIIIDDKAKFAKDTWFAEEAESLSLTVPEKTTLQNMCWR